MKPILTIDDFSRGITYDETESTLDGFSDLQNIDIKNINGVAMLASDYRNAFSTSNFANTNHFIERILIPDVLFSGNSQIFGLKNGGNATVYMGQTDAKSFAVIQADTGGQGCPKYAESIFFQNRLIYPTDKRQLNSLSVWTTGNVAAITANGTTTVDITLVSGATIQDADDSLEGGTMYLYIGGTWVTRNIVSYAALQFVLDIAVTAGTYYAYVIAPAAGVDQADGTLTTLLTPNNSTLYRPMIEKDSKLYVGDADMIYSLDSTLVNWKTTNGDGAISVGSNYVVKQMKQLGGYIYILADRIDANFTNTFAAPNMFSSSKLYIWDGTSVGFNNIIEIGTHCFCIEAIENRLWATLQSNKNDGILFTYFNGSDFPTVAKFQIPSASMPVAGITYDRGRFYCAVNSLVTGTYNSYIFSYSSYAVEDPAVAKQYMQTGTLFQINSIDIIQLGIIPLFVFNDNGSAGSSNGTFYRRDDLFTPNGHIITQKYEISPNQFGQLVKGVQIGFKETMTADCSVGVYYKMDEETAFTLIGTLTSANQNVVLYGIQRRPRDIMLDIKLMTNTGANTPKIDRINLY